MQYFSLSLSDLKVVGCMHDGTVSRMSMVNINYHSNDLYTQILKMMGESIINEVLEMTILFVTAIILVETKNGCLNISVGISREERDVKLIFRYRCRRYAPILNAVDKASYIDEFFKYYFDKIRHEYIDGENKLTFSFTMMSNAEMQRKYLDALDKQHIKKK
jgi:hypothetical protein